MTLKLLMIFSQAESEGTCLLLPGPEGGEGDSEGEQGCESVNHELQGGCSHGN